ncbi:MAG TPA: hypothetical protein VLM05_20575 [Mycobacteriales bacterium]|nr:hypothetical protein [Mycobacteriales bacterium]
MLPAIAFCPTPPLLVPEVAAGAAAELEPLRAACREAVRRLLATAPDEVVVIATGPVSSQFPPGTIGTLAGYGLPLSATLPSPPARVRPSGRLARRAHYLSGPVGAVAAAVPLGVTLGAWLLAGADAYCSAFAVGPEAEPAVFGAALDVADRRRALLVMGDGSARRSERAPGYVDPRAEPFDAAVAAALGTADAAALAGLDPVLGSALLADGVPAWRTAAAAVLAADESGADRSYEAELLYDAAPYGVGYFVATWLAP